MAKPTDVPEWALDDDFATGPAPVVGTPTKVDPTALKNQGFVPGTAAAAQIMNWLLNRNGRWAKWLDGLVDDDGSAAQVKRGLLQLVHAAQADIVAGDVSGAYARLRGEPGLAHTVASAVEEAVYAALTSWVADERARLTLRGAIREIIGRDVAGANAPVTIPDGLNVGTSFTPPAGYLPGAPTYFTTPGSPTWSFPVRARAALVEAVGGGGRGAVASDAGYSWRHGGGGGAYASGIFSADDGSLSLTVGAGGSVSSPDGGNSEVTQNSVLILRAGGGLASSGFSPGAGGTTAPQTAPFGQAGSYGTSACCPDDAPSGRFNGFRAAGGRSGGPWLLGKGGDAYAGSTPNINGLNGVIVITPLY